MLTEAARLAEGPVADSYADGDRNPPTFDPATHSVRLPESVKRAVQACHAGDWWRVGKSAAASGVPAPHCDCSLPQKSLPQLSTTILPRSTDIDTTIMELDETAF